MTEASAAWMREFLEVLLRRQELSPQLVRQFFLEVLDGHAGEAELAAALTAWRLKGETAAELAAAATVLLERMVPFDPGPAEVLDTCGTGGDGLRTFNVSTAAALVVAAAGVPVVKHGNRAASSRSGSADVLAALGMALQASPEQLQRCLRETGFAFCFAPCFHPGLRQVAGVRRQLGFRTVFNCLGPLVNPARACRKLLGVGQPELLDPLAGAAARLGLQRAFLVCGREGLDEVSLSGPTLVREVRGDTVTARQWQPQDFGLQPCRLEELVVNGPEQSAAVLRGVLEGRPGAARRVVLANAAAALLAADRVATLAEGAQLAAAVIDAGKAAGVLQRLIALCPGKGD